MRRAYGGLRPLATTDVALGSNLKPIPISEPPSFFGRFRVKNFRQMRSTEDETEREERPHFRHGDGVVGLIRCI